MITLYVSVTVSANVMLVFVFACYFCSYFVLPVRDTFALLIRDDSACMLCCQGGPGIRGFMTTLCNVPLSTSCII